MSEILVDSNVILDVLTEDPQWFEWGRVVLHKCGEITGIARLEGVLFAVNKDKGTGWLKYLGIL